MANYLTDVVAGGETPAEETVAASGGTGGASYPILKEGDIKEPSKSEELKTVLSGKKRKVKFSTQTEYALQNALSEYNSEAPEGRRANIDMLRAAYRRGVGTFNNSTTGTMDYHSWAMARVAAFTALLSDENKVNSKYTADYDLLPEGHPKAAVMASADNGESVYDAALTVSILDEDAYESQEAAVFSLAEFSGLGYEILPALRTAWIRGIEARQNPFERASLLASALYESPDADLLPLKGIL